MIVDVSRSPRFVALVRSFPVLGGRSDLGPAPGVLEDAVDLDLLDRWAAKEPVHTEHRGPFPGDGATEAARFVLAVWSTRHPWRCGPFDLFRALLAWDHEQTAAFQAWALNPFRP